MFVRIKKFAVVFFLLLSLPIMAGEKQEKEFVYTSQMSCEHCVAAIKKALFKVRKVKSYQANPETDLIKIVFADKQEPLSEKEIKTIRSESDYMLVLKK